MTLSALAPAEPPGPGPRLRAELLLGGALGVGLAVLTYVVLAPFLVPLAWAAILVYATWPLHARLRSLLGGREALAAAVMTLLLVLAVAGPLTLLSVALADEVAGLYHALRAWGREWPELPAWVAGLPGVGPPLVAWYARFRADPGELQALLAEQAPRWAQALLSALGGVGRNLARLGLTLLTAFFLYRHGEQIVRDARGALQRLGGQTVERWLPLVGATIRAVCYGILLTAVAQGTLAGLGFWVVGVPSPVLLGALTTLLAFVPFGPPLVWGPVGLWLLLTRPNLWWGLGLLVWGAVAVSGVDNIIRPYFIGGATRVPFLLVLFGVLGGLGAFGLLGLFVGPTVLAVGLVLWREWVGGPRAEAGAAGDLAVR